MSTIIKLVKLNATLSQPLTINEEIMLRTQDLQKKPENINVLCNLVQPLLANL
jgi:hypothetical protein